MINRFAPWRLVVLSVVVFGCQHALLRNAALVPEPRRLVQLDPYFRQLRTTRVDSPSGPLTMLVDTGGGATLVVPSVAHRLGCQPAGRDVGHRMTGETVVFARCSAPVLTAAGLRLTLPTLAVFDVNTLLPVELPDLDGVLALDAFQGYVVTLDWPASQIRVGNEIGSHTNSVPLRIATGTNGRFFTPFVRVDGLRGPLWFLLDSGNLRGTLVARHVVEQALLDVTDEGAIFGNRSERRVHVEPMDIILDGVFGVETLLEGPVTLDLRNLRSHSAESLDAVTRSRSSWR